MRRARAWARPVAILAAAVAAFVGPAATSAHAGTATSAYGGTTPAAPVSLTTADDAAMTGQAPAVAPATTSDTTSPAGTTKGAGEGSLEIDFTEIAPAVLRPDQPLTVSGTVTNGTDQDLSAPTLRLRMQRSTPISRTTLQRWLAPDSVFSTVLLAHEELPEKLPAGATTTFSFDVPAADLPLTDASWGPRGIEVAVDDVAGDPVGATDRSFLL